MTDFQERRPLQPLSFYKELHAAKGRKAHGVFLLEGIRAVAQVAETRPESIVEILHVDELNQELRRFPVRELDARQMKSVSAQSTPQGLAAVIRLPEDAYTANLPAEPGRRVLALDGVQDPGNVGTLIRTAAAFGFGGVLLSDACADPFAPKVAQATAGALGSLWIRKGPAFMEALRTLRDGGAVLAVADLRGTEPPDVLGGYPKLVLLLGSEASGPSPEALDLADVSVRIPMHADKVESLNVAVSGGILMYLAARPGWVP